MERYMSGYGRPRSSSRDRRSGSGTARPRYDDRDSTPDPRYGPARRVSSRDEYDNRGIRSTSSGGGWYYGPGCGGSGRYEEGGRAEYGSASRGGSDRYTSGSSDRYGSAGGSGDRYGTERGQQSDRYGGRQQSDRYGGQQSDRYGVGQQSDRYGGSSGGADRYSSSAASDRYSSGPQAGGSRYGDDGGRDPAPRQDDRGSSNRPQGGSSSYGAGAGSGGRGGRGGYNPNMNELSNLRSDMKRHPDMSDEAILRIINPPYADRDRSRLVGDGLFMSVLEKWRVHGQQLGMPVGGDICANFFKLDPRMLPPNIFHYNVSIFRWGKEGLDTKDMAKEREAGMNTAIVKNFIENQAHDFMRIDPMTGESIGTVYDGKSSLYSTKSFHFPQHDRPGRDTGDDAIETSSHSSSVHHDSEVLFDGKAYSLIISRVRGETIRRVNLSDADWLVSEQNTQVAMQALDIATLAFARWQLGDDDPSWLISGTKAFRTDGVKFQFAPMYLGRLGYNASIRSTAAGLTLVSEVSMTCFLKGGRLLVDLMALIGNYRNAEDLYQNPQVYDDPNGVFMQKVFDILKNVKIKVVHLNHFKKLKEFYAPADDRSTAFNLDGRFITVAEYYAYKAIEDPRYRYFNENGYLKFPHFPTVVTGKQQDGKRVLVPAEFVSIPEGQVRNQPPPEVASGIIREAAMVPVKRFNFLANEDQTSLMNALQTDTTFGMGGIKNKPMRVKATILPPPKIQYGNGRTIEPELKGSWNMIGGQTFAQAAPAPVNNQYLYGLVTVYVERRPGNRDIDSAADFQRRIEDESRLVNTPLSLCSKPEIIDARNSGNMASTFSFLKKKGARILLVLLYKDVYPMVKYQADCICLPTQCVKWDRIVKPPKSYHCSLMIKMQYKLGGVGHTLAQRGNRTPADKTSFQQPPKSISWLFEESCMAMGVDVNHPEMGKSGDSVAAVVGSMDGRLGQYCAHISRCAGDRKETVNNLLDATDKLLATFKQRNGVYPRRIIIYRDGVADNQFQQVLETEINQYKGALALHGFMEKGIPIAVVMCQKRHNTRLVYHCDKNEAEQVGAEYLNPAVGLCVDGRNFIDSAGLNKDDNDKDPIGCINTPKANEFYLNSHAAVLGTSKPCKYTLIYDEIGLKLTELELLTFWMTHLYCRCTRSVSYVTPAYYAHWAARRGKYQLQGGASSQDLQVISEKWLEETIPSMYFT